MDKDKIYAFYEKSYFRDLDDLNNIISRFPLLIAGVALLVNAYIFLFKLKSFLSLNSWCILSISFVIIFCMGSLLYNLYLAFKPRYYEKMPQLFELEEYRNECEQYQKSISRYNEENPKNYQKEVKWEDMFRDYLIENFIQRSKNNGPVLEERKKWFHSSVKWICINLILCITIPSLILLKKTLGS